MQSRQRELLSAEAHDVTNRVPLAGLFDKSVLITGATGLIGRNLMATIAAAGGRPDALARGDAITPITSKCDYIIHAAGYAQPSRFLADPMGTAHVNTTMLMQLIGVLKPKGRLLFLSSSEVYSGNPRGLHNEGDTGAINFTHPRSIYVHSKMCGEAICKSAAVAGKNVVVARVCSVYGPGAADGDTRVVSEFITQALRDGVVEPKDGGAARRNFCYVGDAVEMLLNIMLSGQRGVYNVGGVGETTILGLARRVADLTRAQTRSAYKNHKVYSQQAAEGAPAHVGVDISRYQQEFGPKTFMRLEEGLARTIEWHRTMVHADGVAA